MPFAFVHLFFAWCLGKAFEFITKRKIHPAGWFLLLFGAILPDADIVLGWILGDNLHRNFTHSLFFIILIGLGSYFIFTLLRDKHKEGFAFALSVGILSHLILDFFSVQGIPLFWPSEIYFSVFGITAYDPALQFLKENYESLLNTTKFMLFDMALGTAWIFYLALRKRIKF